MKGTYIFGRKEKGTNIVKVNNLCSWMDEWSERLFLPSLTIDFDFQSLSPILFSQHQVYSFHPLSIFDSTSSINHEFCYIMNITTTKRNCSSCGHGQFSSTTFPCQLDSSSYQLPSRNNRTKARRTYIHT